MEDKQLIVAVESTAAMGPYWEIIRTDYLDKIIRSFGGNDSAGQKPSTSNVEFALVTFSTRGGYSDCIVRRTGWTSDPDMFCQWLSALPFVGGGFDDAAIAEGLSEALMMFPTPQNGNQNQQSVDLQKHCILVAARNPYPLPTPVYVPRLQNLDQGESIESDAGNRLHDAEAVAKAFPQCSVSLSVICPKQLPKVIAIYNAGKRNSRTADPPFDSKNSHFLILISESFREARSALSRSGITTLPSNQSPVKVDAGHVAPVTGTIPTSLPQVNGSITNRQPISAGNVAPATIKVEPVPVTSMVSGPTFPHMPSVPRAPNQGVPSLQTSSPSSASQDIMATNENTQDVKPMMPVSQPLRPVGPAQANVNILNNLSQARQVLSGGTSMGLQPMGQTPVAMHMSNMISSGMASSVPPAQNVFSSGPSGVTSISSSGSLTGPVQVGANSGLGSLTSATSNVSGSSNMGISQPLGGNLQGTVSMSQPGLAMSQGNILGAQMVQGGVNMNQNVMSGLGPSVVSSGTGTMIPTPGMSQQVQQGMQPVGVNNAVANMPLQQKTSGAMQSTQSNYVKVWEGSLCGQRQGQPVFITRLEGYQSYTAFESFASNWPATMQIVRLISQDHMNNKQYVGKADFLVFWAMNPHGFLAQLQEKKLCAVIQLPSQTLLLSVSDKACRLIGMLFPGLLFKTSIGMSQPGLAISQGNISGAQMVQGGVNMNQNVMSGLGPSVVSSGTGTMIPTTPEMSQQVQQGMQLLGLNNAAANMPLQQQTSGAMQSTQSKYVKVWEGSLCGQRQGQPVLITRLEGYRSYTASESLASNWPATMQIVRLISQDHMNNKQYVGKADFLIFQAMNPHGFLAQLQEKKLCAVIQLPSQTLLLSVSDKACCLIGMLFPGDMVVFKPQLSSQHQQMQPQQPQQVGHMQQQQLPQLQQAQQQQLPPVQRQQLSQLQQQQLPQLQQQQQQLPQLQQQQLWQLQPQQQQLPQLQQLQHQQQIPQQQQMVGAGMSQVAYVQGPGRSQLVSQGQVSSQGAPNMGGGGFMS